MPTIESYSALVPLNLEDSPDKLVRSRSACRNPWCCAKVAEMRNLALAIGAVAIAAVRHSRLVRGAFSIAKPVTGHDRHHAAAGRRAISISPFRLSAARTRLGQMANAVETFRQNALRKPRAGRQSGRAEAPGRRRPAPGSPASWPNPSKARSPRRSARWRRPRARWTDRPSRCRRSRHENVGRSQNVSTTAAPGFRECLVGRRGG